MNAPVARSGPLQFALDLLAPPQPSLDNFVPGANGAALACLRALAAPGAGGVADGAPPAAFVHLWGPRGSGRSHLLGALQALGPQLQSADRPALPARVPEFLPQRRISVVDDVHELDAGGQAALFRLQDAVRQNPGHVLVTAADLPPAGLQLRDDVRTRLAWGLVFALRPIAEAEQAQALASYARSRGARVDEELVPYMLTRLPRDMRTLVSVLDALDALALQRQRALTVPLLREWLQGQELARGAAAPGAGTGPAEPGAGGQ